MIKDPKYIDLKYDLVDDGLLEIGFGQVDDPHSGSIYVLMGRLTFPKIKGPYPNEWFAIKRRSFSQIRDELDSRVSDAGHTLPEVLLFEAYKYNWEKLNSERKANEKAK